MLMLFFIVQFIPKKQLFPIITLPPIVLPAAKKELFLKTISCVKTHAVYITLLSPIITLVPI